jgi:O-methyltransferase involved in polyketide biosynthesis
MKEKSTMRLGNIQKTLILPLWGRAVETQKSNPLLIDKTAVEIIRKIDYDFDAISKEMSEISQLGWVVRSLLIDRIINRFIEKHPETTIVNIGCGLDTTFERIDNGLIRWYDLDLPDTIELRKKFIQENDRRKYIQSSFLDPEWLNDLIIKDNILFIAAGVFYYFEERQIQDFFHTISDMFPGSEIVFDAASPIGIKMANKMVIRKSGMDEKSFLIWGIKRAKDIQLWDNRIDILGEDLFFKKIKKKLPFGTRIKLSFSDMFRMQYLIHLKIRENNNPSTVI